MFSFSHQAYALTAPCIRYGFVYNYALNKDSLPEGVHVIEKLDNYDDKIFFLVNDSSTPLYLRVIESTVYKFQNGKAYMKYINNKYGTDNYFEVGQNQSNDAGSLERIPTRIGGSKIDFPANLNPKIPEPRKLSFAAEYNGKKIEMEGEVSYELKENLCWKNLNQHSLFEKMYFLIKTFIGYFYYLPLSYNINSN